MIRGENFGMEDDIWEKEDDLEKLTPSRTSLTLKNDTTKMSFGQEESVGFVRDRLPGTCSYPPSLGVEENKESLTPGLLSSTRKGDNTRGDPHNTLKQLSGSVHGGPFVDKKLTVKTGSITIGGVKLEEVLKRKRGQEDPNTKKTTNKKTTGRKNNVKTTPSSEKNNETITRYFVKKTVVKEHTSKEDNQVKEDNLMDREQPASLSTGGHDEEDQNCPDNMESVKTTFSDVCNDNIVKKKSMGDRISRFQDIVNKSAVCVTGSGRCATHNQKLVRRVISKKQSCVDKCGRVGWRLCDFTILECPTSLSSAPGMAGGVNNTVMSELRRETSTNKNIEYTNNYEEDQSTAGPVVKRNKTE